MNLVFLRKNAGVFLCLLLATLVVVSFVTLELPGNSLLIGAIQNTGHTLAFFVLTFACLIFTQNRTTGVLTLVLIACMLLGIGLFIEVVQHMTGRGFSGLDLGRNFLGVGAAYCGFMVIQRHMAMHRTTRILLALIATAMIGLSLDKAARLLVSSLLAPSVPQVITFDRWGADLWIDTIGGQASVATHDDIWPSNTTESVKVKFNSKRTRMLQLLEPPADWTGYDTLSFTVFNPSRSPAEVMFRIDEMDKALNLRDGMTIRQHFASGESVITLALEQVRHRVSTEFNYESPPLTSVRAITFFAKGKEQPMELYFDNFFLTR